MPNNVTNILQLEGDAKRIQEVLAAIQSDEFGIGSISFDRLIPMPISLYIECGSRTSEGLKAYNDFIEVYSLVNQSEDSDLLSIPEEAEQAFLRVRPVDPKSWELGKTAFQNKQRYGASTWYEWRIRHWGTKWDAYGFEDAPLRQDGQITFLTAWSPPHPVMQRLTAQFHDVTIHHDWADEDLGYNCGHRDYLNGVLLEEYQPGYGPESIRFAAGIMGINPEELDLDPEEGPTMSSLS